MLSIALSMIFYFILGVISCPILAELYRYYAIYKMDTKHFETMEKISDRHQKQMTTLYKKHDRQVDQYNGQLEKIKKKLMHRNLSVEIDKEGNEILVKKEYNLSHFSKWTKRKN